MGQPVKLSDALILDARIAAEAQQRSIAGQVEFWATLGQTVEPLLSGRKVLQLRQVGKAKPLDEILASVETPEGRARNKVYLDSLPFPHYRQFPGMPRTYIRTDAEGNELVGRFEGKNFVAVDADALRRATIPQGQVASVSQAERLA